MPIDPSTSPTTSPTTLSTAALIELRAGRKRNAVRVVHGDTGLGLKESRGLVERYIAADPTLQQLNALHDRELRRRGMRVLVVSIALVLLAAYLVLGR